jgi:uncharacterized protein RhaS with RHS repeats
MVQQFDPHGGLYRLGARYYAPGFGQFTSRDTILVLSYMGFYVVGAVLNQLAVITHSKVGFPLVSQIFHRESLAIG